LNFTQSFSGENIMRKQTFVLSLGVLFTAVMLAGALLIACAQWSATGGARGEVSSAGDYKLTGPYTYKNLSIFLVHGATTIKSKSFLTLQEALVQKKIVVYETQSVNELSIQNFSDQDVYVQSGDIVKGGQQDRMIGVDLIVPAHSDKLPISAFCVEHGRWTARGDERAAVFSSSSDSATTRELKLAAKRATSQGEVWRSVSVAQEKLSRNVGARVNSPVSESSLQLAVENTRVRGTAENYVKALQGIVDGSDDIIGYVFAINGQVNSADIYGSNVLFKKLWPKLLNANAIEAIAELQDGKFKPATVDNAKGFLSDSEKAKGSAKDVDARVNLLTREDDENIFFETRDKQQGGTWVHRNYIKKN
jgi:hypothetical protein